MDRPAYTLKRYFGYDSFRPGQRSIIDAILMGRDVLGILPTGGGKSICYQVPALILPGLTVVVSPLLSLMHDQTDALLRRGIPAAILTSEMTAEQQRQFYSGFDGTVRILYVSPERLQTPAFISFAARANISLLCIDEAHCISQWGHEFRPSYLSISAFAGKLPVRPVIAAFTATATPMVRDEIIELTGLRDPYIHASTFDRTNLYYEIRRTRDKTAEVLRLLRSYSGMSGIVYCMTRSHVDMLTRRIIMSGIPAGRYHAGMDPEDRIRSQDEWLTGRTPVIVATNAFGMGIDKPDVRFVIHYEMPGCIENYYQEAGRAGRDGKPSDCILIASDSDVKVNRFFLDRTASPVMREAMQRQMDAMREYVGARTCLRRFLLRYFGEDMSGMPGSCGHCSVCLSRTQGSYPYAPGEPDPDLRKSLVAVRLRLSKAENIVQWKIFSEDALTDMAALRPETMAQLLLMEHVSWRQGIKYGAHFLAEIRTWKRSHGI
ncbi:MAG: RecQ family ATP-dependent DNA helicase [Lachnospiraceae bacterium]|nr:RecQ family ATP-dependent DNA helicase [Lachnospiraceae bacterium]